MWRNYLKLGWRNLLRDKGFSLINILGLAVGMATCLLILLWVVDEFSYDRWNEKADRIYRATAEINFGGSHVHYAVMPAPLAAAMRTDFPEVEASTRFRQSGSYLVKRDVQNFKEDRVVFADSTLFEVFSLELLSGDPQRALAAPGSVVITESIAEKYFPGQDAMGQQLTFDNDKKATVTGVIADMPDNSHFHFDFFRSMTSNPDIDDGVWVSHNLHTYFVLREGTDAKAFEAKLFDHILQRYIAPQVQTMLGQSYEDLEKSGAFIRYSIQPLTDIHLHSDLAVELEANGSIQYVWLFLAVAVFILFIALVNFMNLATARSARRAREIGVRKVMGSTRGDLVRQFLGESVLVAWIAIVLGLALALVALPAYNMLADKSLRLPLTDPLFWLALVGGATFIGVLAGSYPAFFLAGFRPVKILQGELSDAMRGGRLRSGLVVFQFFVAIMLIVSTLVVSQQLRFIHQTRLGFDRDRVVTIQDAYGLDKNLPTFKAEARRLPNVSAVTVSDYLPVPSSRSNSPLCKSATFKDDNCVSTQYWNIDEDYLSTLSMEISAGRNFSPADHPTDSNTVLLNETLARMLFGEENPLHKQVFAAVNFDADGQVQYDPFTVIGVVKDFHFESLRQHIGPIVFFLAPSEGSMALKIGGTDLTATINSLERLWKELAPYQPFNYQFLDERFDQMYRAELRIGRIFGLFTGLSLFVACLGLFGLTAYAVERRTKEIGIRKVLGASSTHIIGLFSRHFLWLVLIAFLLAAPLAWWGMHRWLQDFAYRSPLAWWIFPLAIGATAAIALLTIAIQSLRVATGSPVDSLRRE